MGPSIVVSQRPPSSPSHLLSSFHPITIRRSSSLDKRSCTSSCAVHLPRLTLPLLKARMRRPPSTPCALVICTNNTLPRVLPKNNNLHLLLSIYPTSVGHRHSPAHPHKHRAHDGTTNSPAPPPTKRMGPRSPPTTGDPVPRPRPRPLPTCRTASPGPLPPACTASSSTSSGATMIAEPVFFWRDDDSPALP